MYKRLFYSNNERVKRPVPKGVPPPSLWISKQQTAKRDQHLNISVCTWQMPPLTCVQLQIRTLEPEPRRGSGTGGGLNFFCSAVQLSANQRRRCFAPSVRDALSLARGQRRFIHNVFILTDTCDKSLHPVEANRKRSDTWSVEESTFATYLYYLSYFESSFFFSTTFYILHQCYFNADEFVCLVSRQFKRELELERN